MIYRIFRFIKRQILILFALLFVLIGLCLLFSPIYFTIFNSPLYFLLFLISWIPFLVCLDFAKAILSII